MINNTEEYISLQRKRAEGLLPDMGCSIRVTNLVNARTGTNDEQKQELDILDVGCATGHLYRTFIRRGVNISTYTGLEIDRGMVEAANEVWSGEIHKGKMEFINEDIEQFGGDRKFDFVICVNAFMYFASAEKALRKLMNMTLHHLIIRSYFTDFNYRIARAQTKQNHDKARLDEIDVFDAEGRMLCYDFWNMYSHSYIEALVAKIDPNAQIEWVEDENFLASIEEEGKLEVVKKRGATEIFQGQEISYPFFLPWRYLVVSYGLS
jgi:SAM-dependent methyltransferase